MTVRALSRNDRDGRLVEMTVRCFGRNDRDGHSVVMIGRGALPKWQGMARSVKNRKAKKEAGQGNKRKILVRNIWNSHLGGGNFETSWAGSEQDRPFYESTPVRTMLTLPVYYILLIIVV